MLYNCIMLTGFSTCDRITRAARIILIIVVGFAATFCMFYGKIIYAGVRLAPREGSVQPAVDSVKDWDKNLKMRGPYDIMRMRPIQFNASYKNPCWFGKGGNGPLQDGQLHCLPYFYIIGVKKSGTTDLYARIERHQEFCHPSFKESQWMSRIRFGIKAASLKKKGVKKALAKGIDKQTADFFISMYDLAAKCIQNISSKVDDKPEYSGITGDACPATFHMHTKWEELPGNEGLQEPKYTNFHYIGHLTPGAKFIMIMREPVSRLYSDFVHTTLSSNTSPAVFHKHASILVQTYTTCFKTRSMRSCVYDNGLQHTLMKRGIEIAESFHAGFYAFFLKEIRSVVDSSQVLPVLMSDYLTNMEGTMKKVFNFLGMSPVSSEKMHLILNISAQNTARKSVKPMNPETKQMLQKFFRPFNEDMAKLMNDNRYLFEDS